MHYSIVDLNTTKVDPRSTLFDPNTTVDTHHRNFTNRVKCIDTHLKTCFEAFEDTVMMLLWDDDEIEKLDEKKQLNKKYKAKTKAILNLPFHTTKKDSVDKLWWLDNLGFWIIEHEDSYPDDTVCITEVKYEKMFQESLGEF